MKLPEDQTIREALIKYGRSYILTKSKTKTEKELSEEKRRYVVYARKSTEGEERQVQSIEDQIESCLKFAKENNLEIVDILKEEKSAKTAGKRKVFNFILDTISKGETFNSIIAWHPDRLARNMKEAGEILDMLDSNKIIDLKFPSHSFSNDAAGKMTLSILFAMAKEFSDKLSADTKRGIKKKVNKGKYCGSTKKGYYVSREEYFRPDEESYKAYSKMWQLNLKGYSYKVIAKKFPKEKLDVNKLSKFFKDPFSAGIYCYGEQVVDITKVDTSFKPLVSGKEFLSVQKLRPHKGGWQNTQDFLPFRDLVICNSCGNPMTPGRSKSKTGIRYLYVSCGNNNCKESRRSEKRPANSIRGEILADFTVGFINEQLEMKKELYDSIIKKERQDKEKALRGLREEVRNMKIKKTKTENVLHGYEEELTGESKDDLLSERIAQKLKEINSHKESIKELKKEIANIELRIELDLPAYEDFVNFFKDAVIAMETTQDHTLVDDIVKMVFLNFLVDDKKVLSYDLNEPFKTYNLMKISHGVEDGT